ncbi:uncharacterized protein AB675_10169 [Cyphellophora attinorum]|uniref:Copper acquisition factor BIM1-like domain-containing protein n=1 Tax=Cyphellophora attinorum TaxID=1664694 RepID=A0A0N1H3T6_9EURO|nr:uncharacterized protein AB675_10169 [Phialophora attinorum]KPI35162.1 hypothetical protein AB675_10169 [Phialophora attinorum]
MCVRTYITETCTKCNNEIEPRARSEVIKCWWEKLRTGRCSKETLAFKNILVDGCDNCKTTSEKHRELLVERREKEKAEKKAKEQISVLEQEGWESQEANSIIFSSSITISNDVPLKRPDTAQNSTHQQPTTTQHGLPHLNRLITLLPALTTAHFHLHFPAARGEDTDKQADFPCGGYPTPASTRIPISLTSGLPLSMELGHDENLISVFLAIGNDPGNVASLGIEEGTNATVQVITNGHAGNGLYNCADITFTNTSPATPETCTNNTGITAEAFTGTTLANTTMAEEDHEGHGDNATETASATDAGTSATSASSAGAGAIATAAGWGVVGAGVMGAVALL